MGNKFTSILKLISSVIFFPILVAVSVSFSNELQKLSPRLVASFVWGIFTYLLIHLLLYEPAPVYQKGQKITEVVFKFFAPLVRLASFFLPIFSILLLTAFYVLTVTLSKPLRLEYQIYFMFFVSLFMVLHIVFTAASLRSRQTDFLKANYFFAMEFIYIINIGIIAGMFSLIFEDFSFLNFYNSTCNISKAIFLVVFNQLFQVKT